MLEPFRIDGYWNLPGSEAHIAGVLTFDPIMGVELALQGTLDDELFLTTEVRYHVVLGVLSSGKDATLFDCLEAGREFSIPGYPRSRLRVRLLVIGAAIASYNELKPTEVHVSYQNLEEIMGMTAIQEVITVTAAPTPDITLRIEQPPPLEAAIGVYAVRSGFGWEVRGDRDRERGFAQQAALTLVPSGPQHFDDFLRGPLRTLQTFVELAVGNSLPIRKLALKLVRSDHPDSDRLCDVYFAQVAKLPLGRSRHRAELLFTLEGIRSKFAEALQAWHTGRDRYGPIFDLFFSVDRSQMYVEHQFLNLIQVLEAYHRRAKGGRALPEERHRELLHRVQDALGRDPAMTSEDALWAAERLRFNEISLAKRLREIVDSMPTVVKEAIDDREDFVQRVRDTRNYLTHWDESSKRKAWDGAELALPVQWLRLLVRVILLTEARLLDNVRLSALPELRLINLWKGDAPSSA